MLQIAPCCARLCERKQALLLYHSSFRLVQLAHLHISSRALQFAQAQQLFQAGTTGTLAHFLKAPSIRSSTTALSAWYKWQTSSEGPSIHAIAQAPKLFQPGTLAQFFEGPSICAITQIPWLVQPGTAGKFFEPPSICAVAQTP